jgi:hypothetical protein
MQVELPVIRATGTPPAFARIAPVSHCPVAQGGDPVPVSAHPVTV